jgi:hypothetical protein
VYVMEHTILLVCAHTLQDAFCCAVLHTICRYFLSGTHLEPVLMVLLLLLHVLPRAPSIVNTL